MKQCMLLVLITTCISCTKQEKAYGNFAEQAPPPPAAVCGEAIPEPPPPPPPVLTH